jgi:hypothetical protein
MIKDNICWSEAQALQANKKRLPMTTATRCRGANPVRLFWSRCKRLLPWGKRAGRTKSVAMRGGS